MTALKYFLPQKQLKNHTDLFYFDGLGSLRFYKLCRAWVTDVKRNKQANMQKLKFEESEVMMEMLRSLEQDLGVNVSLEEADLMYLMCNFDLAWNPAATRF